MCGGGRCGCGVVNNGHDSDGRCVVMIVVGWWSLWGDGRCGVVFVMRWWSLWGFGRYGMVVVVRCWSL